MAMRLRLIKNKWVALCAANSEPVSDDIYLDDAQDHAIRVKLEHDWRSEGVIFDLNTGDNMKRFRLEGTMTKVDDGEWVKFDEAALKIIRLQNRIKTLKTDRDYFKKKVTKRNLSGDIK